MKLKDNLIRKKAKRIAEKDIKRIELEGLKELDRICKKHSIRYFLMFGTLIGAVRHNGFIPWDDDIDVAMMRTDYDRFIKLCKEGTIKSKDWLFESFQTEDKHVKFFMRMVNRNTVVLPCHQRNGHYFGIPIDIFPIDALRGDNEQEALQDFDDVKDRYTVAIRLCRPYTVLKKGARNFIKRHTYNLYYKIFNGRRREKTVMREIYAGLEEYSRSIRPVKYVTQYACYYRTVWKIEDLIDGEQALPELMFEGYRFPVPVHYDEILRHTYGDYMKLPPVEKQVSHGYEAYYLEK